MGKRLTLGVTGRGAEHSRNPVKSVSRAPVDAHVRRSAHVRGYSFHTVFDFANTDLGYLLDVCNIQNETWPKALPL